MSWKIAFICDCNYDRFALLSFLFLVKCWMKICNNDTLDSYVLRHLAMGQTPQLKHDYKCSVSKTSRLISDNRDACTRLCISVNKPYRVSLLWWKLDLRVSVGGNFRWSFSTQVANDAPFALFPLFFFFFKNFNKTDVVF